MSIETAIERIADKVFDAYASVETKGGTVPTEKKIANLPDAIKSIPSTVGINLQEKNVSVTQNGTSTVTPDSGYDGLSSVNLSVNVSGGGDQPVNLQEKDVTPSKTVQTVIPDESYDGLSKVTVDKIPDAYQDTSDATASASDILSGKTAYINGEKVTGTATGTAASPVLQEKTVTPGASTKTVTPDESYDGLSKVTVDGDSNLVAANIKSGVSIFGVTGTASGGGASKLQAKTVIPTAFEQTVTPDVAYDGLSKVTVTAIPEEPQNREYRWWSPNMSSNTTPSPYQLFGDSLQSNSYTALDASSGSVATLEPPTNDEDSIPELGFDFGTPAKIGGIKIAGTATNIETVKILGNNSGPDNDFTEIVSEDVYDELEANGIVTITFDPVAYRYFKFLFVEHSSSGDRQIKVSEITFYREFVISNVNLQAKTISPSTDEQKVVADSTYDGLSEVTVTGVNLQSKNVTPSASEQTVTPDIGYMGLSSVNVAASPPPTFQEKTVTPTASSQTVTPDGSYDGLSKVTVNAIPSSYKDTSDGTAAASDILSGKTAYVNGNKVTGSMSSNTLSTPTISVSSAGKITASITQSAGYTSGGTKTATEQLTTKSAETFTPGTTNKTISSGQYLTGTQTISGDSNLKAANIKSGVSIFGVSGSYTGTAPTLQTKTVSPKTSSQTVTPDSGYDGLSKVTVNAVSLTTKTVTPSSSSQTVTPSSSYLGFSSVTVNAIPASYTPAGIITLSLTGGANYNGIGIEWFEVGTDGTTNTNKRGLLEDNRTIHIRMCSSVTFLSIASGNSSYVTASGLTLSGTGSANLALKVATIEQSTNKTTIGFSYNPTDLSFTNSGGYYRNAARSFSIVPRNGVASSVYSTNYSLTLAVSLSGYDSFS